MLKCAAGDDKVVSIVRHFADYDTHKSHGRSIGRKDAMTLGVKVEFIERRTQLHRLVRSLHSQYLFMMLHTGFYKLFENAYDVGYGRQVVVHQIPVPQQSPTPPTPPQT